MDSVAVVFLSVFINRVTETVKRSLIDGQNLTDETKGAIVLGLSLLLGILGVVFLFPSTNLVPGQGASPFAEQIVTGVIIGGLANGIDFLAKVGASALDKSTPKAA